MKTKPVERNIIHLGHNPTREVNSVYKPDYVRGTGRLLNVETQSINADGCLNSLQ